MNQYPFPLQPILEPDELEPLSFTITDPWRPVVKPPPTRSGYVASRRSWSWKIPAVCGGTFVLGMFVMIAVGILEAPSTSRMPTTARMPPPPPSAEPLPPPPPPPSVVEIVTLPPPAPPKPVRRARPAPKHPHVVVATPGLFDSPD
jgi:hypothetical protein